MASHRSAVPWRPALEAPDSSWRTWRPVRCYRFVECFGPTLDPAGLGLAYTAMAEQAYGVGLQNTFARPVSARWNHVDGTNPTTIAELQAYLKNLGLAYDTATGARAQRPPIRAVVTQDGPPSTSTPPPFPATPINSTWRSGQSRR